MRYGICVPNLGEFAHPRRVAALAGVARGFLRPADAAGLISAAAKSSVP